jgi:hypothetical protein
MQIDDSIPNAVESGRKQADEILKSRGAALARRAVALHANPKRFALRAPSAERPESAESLATLQTAGYLAAAGDSWFDYPFHDVLKSLRMSMVTTWNSPPTKVTPWRRWLTRPARLTDLHASWERIQAHGGVPKAVLISGGGDDIAGNEFGMLSNNAFSPIAGWDDEVIAGVLKRILTAYTQILSSIHTAFVHYFPKRELHILLHGYDYPVPDGRGFFGGWPFPGPWLEPGFREKNFKIVRKRIDLMHELMDRFNGMVTALKLPGATIHYIDLRNNLSTDPAEYKEWWANELHPTERGFEAVAKKFVAVLDTIP